MAIGKSDVKKGLRRSLLTMVDANVAFKAVHASRGKYTRAEPVSALYEQGRIRHVGALPLLEDQMCSFTPDLDRERAKSSPDRVDALVWAFTELMVEGMAQAWIDHYGALASAAHAPTASSPDTGGGRPGRSRPMLPFPADNELTDLYRETLRAITAGSNVTRCRGCGEAMVAGTTRVTDGIDVWHPGCSLNQ